MYIKKLRKIGKYTTTKSQSFLEEIILNSTNKKFDVQDQCAINFALKNIKG